jgi:hypothetical protein
VNLVDYRKPSARHGRLLFVVFPVLHVRTSCGANDDACQVSAVALLYLAYQLVVLPITSLVDIANSRASHFISVFSSNDYSP